MIIVIPLVVYFFVFIYFIGFTCMLILSNFWELWVLIELLMLMFMSISLNTTPNSSSIVSYINYFVVQSLGSISILFCYSAASFDLLTIFLLIKLSIFPFSFWYYSTLYSISSLPIYLALIPQKFPPLFIMYSCLIWLSELTISFLVFFCLINCLIFSFLSYISCDFLSLLLYSSLSSSSWFFLISMSWLSGAVFYLTIYGACTLLLIVFISEYNFIVLVIFIYLGIPPSPLFFINLLAVFNLYFTISFFLWLCVSIGLILSSFLLLILYIRFSISLIIYINTILLLN